MSGAAAWQEKALAIACSGETLFGIVTLPAAPAGEVGALIVVGGPQYRAGSHRQFVLWARAFAEAGVPALRFDVRGMGDSSGATRPFTALDDDLGAAVDALLAACPSLRRVVLCGLCDAASASLMYLDAKADRRVAGLILLNPWVRNEQSQARTYVRHYYLARLTSSAFWLKVLRGGIAIGALRELAANLRRARADDGPARSDARRDFIGRMAAGLRAFPGPVLLVLSGGDYTAKEFLEHIAVDTRWSGLLTCPRLQRQDLDGADHTFSATADRRALERASIDWMACQGWANTPLNRPEPST